MKNTFYSFKSQLLTIFDILGLLKAISGSKEHMGCYWVTENRNI